MDTTLPVIIPVENAINLTPAQRNTCRESVANAAILLVEYIKSPPFPGDARTGESFMELRKVLKLI